MQYIYNFCCEKILKGKHGEHSETIEEKANLASFDGILEAVAYTVNKISCEVSCLGILMG